MKATIFGISKVDGVKSYIGETSADDFFLLTIFAEKKLCNHIRSLSKELNYEYWTICHGYADREGIPKCVNAVAICCKVRGALGKGISQEENEVHYYFQIEYPKQGK